MSQSERYQRINVTGDDRPRAMYARALRLRYLNPSGMLCFLYLEGMISLGLLLALAELVSWWAVVVLPLTVALMVKANDVVAAAVARSAAEVPQRERERFRREVAPAVGRVIVPAGAPPDDVDLTGSRFPVGVRAGRTAVAGGLELLRNERRDVARGRAGVRRSGVAWRGWRARQPGSHRA